MTTLTLNPKQGQPGGQPVRPPSPNGAQEPIFGVGEIQMAFAVSAEYAAAAVANNVLVLALHTGRIMRIDLDVPDEVDDVDLPKKPSEVGVIKRIFLDPTASHLIVCTALGENYYLHTQSKQPKVLSKLRGIGVETIAWNPSQPTASTREILIGASDGTVYETYIESTTEFLRREEKYLKLVTRVDGPVSGIWVDAIPNRPDVRRILIATPSRLLHYYGKLGRHGHEGSGSIFAKLFEAEAPTVRTTQSRPSAAALSVTPEPPDAPGADTSRPERIFAWLSSDGILHGRLITSPQSPELGGKLFAEASTLAIADTPQFIALTQWHALQLVGQKVVAINRLDGSVVFEQTVLNSSHKPLGLMADLKRNTFWLFTNKDIYEIYVTDEDRHVWKVMLKAQDFESALQYANNSAQKDAVATASGDHLISKGLYMEAAAVYGKSSKPFEQVALAFVDSGERDALRKYLKTRLSVMKKSATLQRIMLTSWITELFMAKLNSLEDMVNTKAELAEDQTQDDVKSQLTAVRNDFEEFIRRYTADLDRKTVYDIISSHGREQELLFFSASIGDFNNVLAYWVQRENWTEALKALNRQTDAEITYKYSTVLMANAPTQFIDVIMRQSGLEARKLIPAFLNYNQISKVNLAQNQAIRYLLYEINFKESKDAAVHNTLISIYASHPSTDESALLAYLESQTPTTVVPTGSNPTGLDQVPYDADFALRLCVQHSRIRSCCLIYTSMGQYAAAVNLALAHKETDLAMTMAERPENDVALSKRLWISIARAVIDDPTTTSLFEQAEKKQPKGLALKPQGQQASISTALSLLHRAPQGALRIEDLLPLLPDFVLIDAFKDEICAALQDYSTAIDSLKADMDASASASARIRGEIEAAQDRWVLVSPGDECAVCRLPLLDQRFWVWACGHGAHADCVVARLAESTSGRATATRVKDLRAQAELDELAGASCVACGQAAVGRVDEPFTARAGEASDWRI